MHLSALKKKKKRGQSAVWDENENSDQINMWLSWPSWQLIINTKRKSNHELMLTNRDVRKQMLLRGIQPDVTCFTAASVMNIYFRVSHFLLFCLSAVMTVLTTVTERTNPAMTGSHPQQPPDTWQPRGNYCGLRIKLLNLKTAPGSTLTLSDRCFLIKKRQLPVGFSGKFLHSGPTEWGPVFLRKACKQNEIGHYPG